jgi:hypothetical protein
LYNESINLSDAPIADRICSSVGLGAFGEEIDTDDFDPGSARTIN